MQEAKYLGVAPWELLEQPLVWRHWARTASKAESEANKQKKASQARRKGKMGS